MSKYEFAGGKDSEFVLVHPYREGNGRLGRWIADLMSLQAGFRSLQWNFESDTSSKGIYFESLRKSFAGDLTDLESLIDQVLPF